MGKTLVERMLTKQILTKEFDAEEYIKQYTVMGNVRYTAYFKTRPIGLTYYPIKCSNEIIKLSREAAKTVQQVMNDLVLLEHLFVLMIERPIILQINRFTI